MARPPSETTLPPVRRKKRRDWGRLLARILCVLFAICGLVPIGVGLLVRTKWARGIAEVETRKVLKGYGIDAHFDLELRLWPLSVGLRNLRVESTDGAGPFLTAERANARPKMFGLLAGKLVIDEIEIVRPVARVDFRNGELQNLALNLPETKRTDGSTKPPFSVISTTEADIDLTLDGIHLAAKEIDADVTTDESGDGTAFEIAVRVAEARSRVVRTLKVALPNDPGEYAVDEDLLCRIDGRARVEPKRIVVRRLSAFGVADLDVAEETFGDCNHPKTDKRYVEVALGHLTYQFPPGPNDLPGVDGHVHVRAPLKLIERIKPQPGFDGFATVDLDVRVPPGAFALDRIEASGHLDVTNLKIYKFEFSKSVTADLAVRRGLVTSPEIRVEIAQGVAHVKEVEVALRDRFPIKANLDIEGVAFTKLLQDLKIHPHPHVTWDVENLRIPKLEGTIMPLNIEGDMTAKTSNFAVYDAPMDAPGPKHRATGVKEGLLLGRLGIHPKALEFMNMTVTGPRSVIRGLMVSIGYTEAINVVIPNAKLDLRDLSPLGSVPIAGLADLKATVTGQAGDPKIAGEVISIQDFSIGDKPNDIAFGNIAGARIHLEGLSVILEDVHGQKNGSKFDMPTGRLEFGGEANMRLDGAIVTKSLDVRDFFSVFHMDEDPRFEQIHAQLEANARVHLALGGPEDICRGGYLDVQGVTTARDVDLFGEKFDEARADFEYRWVDRQAGIEGADIDIRSLSLSKVKKEGRPAIGSVLGSVAIKQGGAMHGSLVMQGYPLSRVDLLGNAAAMLEGSASGVARISGSVSSFAVEADVDVTPVRVLGAPFGSSDLQVLLTQTSGPAKVIGQTFCKAKITQPFDKDAYKRDLGKVVSGEITASGHLFGNQVTLDDVKMTRQAKPILSGKVGFSRFDLGPVGRILFPSGEVDDAAVSAFGGELTGDLELARLDTADAAHAKGSFTPKTIKLARGGQRLEWRPPPSTDTRIELADDAVRVPAMVFDLAVGNGFKGAVGVSGAVNKVTHGAELALDAELSPIDLGILVGVVPRLTRAAGTLSGKVKLAGSAASPTFDGQLRVRAGDFAFKGLPGSLTEVEVDVEADENEARVTRGKGHFLGGDVAINGRMPWNGGQLGTMEANVSGRQLSISPSEGVKTTVDADLQVSMNPQATTAAARLPFIAGDVTITAFEYTKPFTLELNGLTRTNRTTVIDAYDPALDAVAFGFDVRSRVPLRLRNNIVDAQLAIDPRGIHVSGTNQRIGLRGELTTLSSGRFRIFANDFEVQKGTIRFDDPTRIVPHIDITAVTEYRRYSNTLASGATGGGAAAGGAGGGGGGLSNNGRIWRITVHAYGDTDKLQIDVTSDPPLSREDIFFLLTIGLTRAEVDQVQAGSVYASAAFEALGTVTGVDRAVKQAIPVIDDFRPGTAYSPRTGRVEPNITVGRRLTDTVRARLTSGLAEDPQLRSTIEWRLNRHFTIEPSYDRINTVSSSNIGNFGIDFRWSLEFD